MAQPMERPDLLHSGTTPIGYTCPRCGCLVPRVDPSDLLRRGLRDPWDVHAEWHQTWHR